MFLKTINAPEFIAVEGLQEWNQAQKMVKNCAGSTGGCLKLVQAFYIGMLALRYRTPRGEKVMWPNQYTWLLEQGLIDWDDHALGAFLKKTYETRVMQTVPLSCWRSAK